MAELKPYVEGQQIEPMKPRIYTTIEEQAELKAYREFGNLSQLRVLCDNYHELLNELRSRPTEAEIRASVIDEFAEKLKRNFRDIGAFTGYEVKREIDELAEQLKERE